MFEAAVNPKTRLVYVSNPNNPTGSTLSSAAMDRIVRRCEEMDALLLADEVYLGAEIQADRTREFLGSKRECSCDERALQGVWYPRGQNWLDCRVGEAHFRLLDAARLTHDLSPTNFRMLWHRSRFKKKTVKRSYRRGTGATPKQSENHGGVGRGSGRGFRVCASYGRGDLFHTVSRRPAKCRAL